MASTAANKSAFAYAEGHILLESTSGRRFRSDLYLSGLRPTSVMSNGGAGAPSLPRSKAAAVEEPTLPVPPSMIT